MEKCSCQNGRVIGERERERESHKTIYNILLSIQPTMLPVTTTAEKVKKFATGWSQSFAIAAGIVGLFGGWSTRRKAKDVCVAEGVFRASMRVIQPKSMLVRAMWGAIADAKNIRFHHLFSDLRNFSFLCRLVELKHHLFFFFFFFPRPPFFVCIRGPDVIGK